MAVRMILGYLFWLFLGGLGVHRFFLGRWRSGLTLLLLTIACVSLVILALGPLLPEIAQVEDPDAMDEDAFAQRAMGSPYMMPATILAGIISLWLLADLILVALIVLKDAEQEDLARQEAGSHRVYAANMDPSFQATQQAVDLDSFDERPRRSAIPDDYVMPWRQENPRGEQKIYKPDED